MKVDFLLAGCLAGLALLTIPGCDSDEPRSGDSVRVVAVYFEADRTVADTSDAHSVFNEYVQTVTAANDTFPDGTKDWSYIQAEPNGWAGEMYWRVEFKSQASAYDWVHVDPRGCVLKVIFFVHSP